MANAFRQFKWCSWLCVTLALLIIPRRTTQSNKYPIYVQHFKTQPKTLRELKQKALNENHVSNLANKIGLQGAKYSSNITWGTRAYADIRQQYNVITNKGRHLLGNNQQRMFDDLQLRDDISEKALSYCPYADFCFLNKSLLWDKRRDRVSCCKDCYCDDGCGERMDCCFDFLDEHKIVESNNLTCVTPRVSKNFQKDKFIHSFFMVDTCLGNNSNNCKDESVAVWGSLYPVYSPSKAMVYFNMKCAVCNNITDAITWNSFVSCAQKYSFNGPEFLEGIKDGRCKIQFAPPAEAEHRKFICYPAAINSCNGSEYSTGMANSMRELCETIRAPVEDFVNNKIYANVFCKLCNGIEHSPRDTCWSYYNILEGIKGTESVNTFTALIDGHLFESRLSMNTPVSDEDALKVEKCGKFEVNHPNKDECRRVYCANGAVRTTKGCQLFATTWYKSGFLLHLILTPVSDKDLPLKAAFEALSLKKKRNVNKWLDTKGIPVDSFVMYAEMVNKQNITYMRRLNILTGSPQYPIKASETINIIESAMRKQWSINLNKKLYFYKVNFDKYEEYIQNGNRPRKLMSAPKSTVNIYEGILPKLYTWVFAGFKMIHFFINKMYFCDKVNLVHGEWISGYQGIWLNLTGRENETFLGDAEFNSDSGHDGEWNIQICVDDFINQGPTAKSSADRLLFRLYFIVLITTSFKPIVV